MDTEAAAEAVEERTGAALWVCLLVCDSGGGG